MMRLFYLSREDLERLNCDLESHRKKIPYVQFVVSLLGLVSSFWTYLLHIHLIAQVGSPLICDVNETINCSKIIGSAQGEFLGVPLGIWGMAFWLIGLGLIFLPRYSKVSLKYISFWRLLISVVGLITALTLVYISYFVLKGICEFCSVVQISCVIYFISSLTSYRKVRKDSYYATKVDFAKMLSTVAVALVLSLIIFASTKNFFHDYYEKPELKILLNQQLENSQNQIAKLSILDNEDLDYSVGKEGAPVTIVEFTDFECPFCQLLHEKLQGLNKFIDSGKVRVYFRNWPLGYHKYATKLAVAARCAGDQGKFWEFADWSFRTAKTYAQNRKQKKKLFSDFNIERKIKSLHLDTVMFRNCIKNPDVFKKIKKDIEDASSLGGLGTPFLLINGVPYKGNWLQGKSLENYISKIVNEK